MRSIIITDGEETITLLRDITFEIEPQEISSSVTMASGRMVKDVIGYKDTLKIPVGYLSLDDMDKLRKMIVTNNGLLQISYPSPTGDITGWFIVDQPLYKTFSYDDNGVAVWEGVTLNAIAVEVGQ